MSMLPLLLKPIETIMLAYTKQPVRLLLDNYLKLTLILKIPKQAI